MRGRGPYSAGRGALAGVVVIVAAGLASGQGASLPPGVVQEGKRFVFTSANFSIEPPPGSWEWTRQTATGGLKGEGFIGVDKSAQEAIFIAFEPSGLVGGIDEPTARSLLDKMTLGLGAGPQDIRVRKAGEPFMGSYFVGAKARPYGGSRTVSLGVWAGSAGGLNYGFGFATEGNDFEPTRFARFAQSFKFLKPPPPPSRAMPIAVASGAGILLIGAALKLSRRS